MTVLKIHIHMVLQLFQVSFPDLRLAFQAHTANTHSLSLVRFDVKSSLIGLIRFYEAEHENTLYQVITNFKPKKC